MKIVFCTLHVRRSAQAVPLAAASVAAALPPGLCKTTTLVDIFPDQPDRQVLDKILACEPELVAFPVYAWNRLRVVELAKQLRRQQPRLHLVAGGPEATGDPAGLRRAAPWTALVHGEGEAVFPGLVEALAAGETGAPLPGITLVKDHDVVQGEPVYRHDLQHTVSPWLSGVLKPETGAGVLWEVARGCAFTCDYCFEARDQTGVRAMDRQRLAQELEGFCKAGVSQVWVLDSTFNYPPERGRSLLELLLEIAPHIHYHLEAKADYIDRPTASLLGELNCSVQLGLQSIHKQVLKSIHRPLDLDVLAEKIHLLEAEGVIYGFDLIYGLAEDNYAGFRQSLDTVLGFSPNHVHIFPLAILPGTRLAQKVDRYGIIAEQQPPYLMLSSDNWSVEELEHCRRLAAAVDIFYNTGRAVTLFPAILQVLQTRPSSLFEDFFKWALQQDNVEYDDLMTTDTWAADDVYRLLQGYLCYQLQRSGQGHLTSIFLDLLCYHFHYAETLIGDELLPPTDMSWQELDLWETTWQRSQLCRLVPFAYEILDLLEMEEMQPEEIATLFRPVGSVALFLRRDNEVFCESLGEDMLRLLKGSDGSITPREIFSGGVSRETGQELIRFAVSEGLLQPGRSELT